MDINTLNNRYLGYQQPTTQTIFIKQKSPYINVSIQQLNQNFQQLIYQNSEQVYYQIQAYDFPTYDDLTQIFQSSTIKIQMLIIPYFKLAEAPYTMNYGYQEGIDSSQKRFSYKIVDFMLPFELQIPQNGFLTANEVANQISQQLVKYSYSYGGVTTTRNDVETVLYYFFQNLKDFSYDSASGKYVFSFKPTMYNLPSQKAPFENNFLPMEIMNFDIYLAPDITHEFSQKQMQYIADIFGSQHDTNDTITLTQALNSSTTQIILPYYSLFKTSFTMNSQLNGIFHEASEINKNTNALLTNVYNSYIFAYSQSYPRFCTSEYIYVHSSADTSIWNKDGIKESIIDILPRNKAFNQIVSLTNSTTFSLTPFTRTKLSSLRSLQLQLCDEDGKQLFFGREFIIKLAIMFN